MTEEQKQKKLQELADELAAIEAADAVKAALMALVFGDAQKRRRVPIKMPADADA